MQPTIGRIVHYKVTSEQAQAINKRRGDYRAGAKTEWINGAQAHVGNHVSEGDVYPLIIVRVWPNEFGDKPGVNGQLILDGNDTYWVTSRGEGVENGQWSWPVKA